MYLMVGWEIGYLGQPSWVAWHHAERTDSADIESNVVVAAMPRRWQVERQDTCEQPTINKNFKRSL